MSKEKFYSGFNIKVKEADPLMQDDENGELPALFEGYATVWDVEDSVGDIIRSDAFDESLALKSKYPLFINHEACDVTESIGVVECIKDDYGLKVIGEVFLHEPNGKSIFHKILKGAIQDMSIGFKVKSYNVIDNEKPMAWEITKAALREVSLVVMGCNELAKIELAKSLDADNQKEAIQAKQEQDILDYKEKMLKRMGDYINANNR